ncbi:MAG: hypothetical protein IJF05_03140 [Clostridia bacterium]|nr:hypothetical protein [Clostridia bacterium]
MKRFLSLLLVVLILATSMLFLASCGKRIPNGTYVNNEIGATYVFKGRRFEYSGPVDRYGMTSGGFGNTRYEGVYKLKADTIEMTTQGKSTATIDSFSMGDSYVVIAGKKYTLTD